MDSYELHLLGMVIDRERLKITSAMEAPRLIVERGSESKEVLIDDRALSDHLRDLGVEVPERPSAERVAEVRKDVNRFWHNAMMFQELNRLTVLALLEGKP